MAFYHMSNYNHLQKMSIMLYFLHPILPVNSLLSCQWSLYIYFLTSCQNRINWYRPFSIRNYYLVSFLASKYNRISPFFLKTGTIGNEWGYLEFSMIFKFIILWTFFSTASLLFTSIGYGLWSLSHLSSPSSLFQVRF